MASVSIAFWICSSVRVSTELVASSSINIGLLFTIALAIVKKQTLKILKKVRNDKSATKAVKDLENIYGKVEEMTIAEGTSTALGTVVYLEEEEENIPVHQASRAVAAALNKAINKEIKRIEALKLENAKFNAALKLMMDAQRQ